MYSLIIFFLVGFVASFFVKNMIIVILFATFVSLFFQSTLRYGDAATEGMETKEDGKTDDKTNDKTDDKTDDKDEGFKFSYQGEEPDLKSDANDKLADKVKEVMKDKVKDVMKDKVKDQGKDQDKDQDKDKGKDKTEKKIISGSNAEQLKKDMKDYFAVQEQLLDVLAKAEPLQQEAMQIKERFSKNKGLN